MKFFFALLLASICFALSSAEDETLLWSDETPIYYMEAVDGEVKIEKDTTRFDNVPAANSGNPQALFPRVLIVTDYPNYQKTKSMGLSILARDVIRNINADFAKMKTDRPVEALLAGLVMMKSPGNYDGSPTASMVDIWGEANIMFNQMFRVENETKQIFPPRPREVNYRKATAELNAFSKWMNDNEDKFADVNAHVYVYLSTYWLVDDTEDLKNANLVMGLTDQSRKICSSKPVVLMTDLIGNTNVLYAMAFSYAMGFSDPRDKPDSPYFTNFIDGIPNDSKRNEWESKVTGAMNDMDQQDKFACLRETNDED